MGLYYYFIFPDNIIDQHRHPFRKMSKVKQGKREKTLVWFINTCIFSKKT